MVSWWVERASIRSHLPISSKHDLAVETVVPTNANSQHQAGCCHPTHDVIECLKFGCILGLRGPGDSPTALWWVPLPVPLQLALPRPLLVLLQLALPRPLLVPLQQVLPRPLLVPQSQLLAPLLR